MKKNNKFIIVTIIVIIIISIVSAITVYKSIKDTNLNSNKHIDNTNNGNNGSNGTDNNEKEDNNIDDSIDKTIGSPKNNKVGEEENKEYPENESQSLYSELCNLANTASYNDIISKVDEIKNKNYKFTEDYNGKISNIYMDSTILLATKDIDDYERRAYMISNLSDVHTYFTGTLMMDEKTRRNIILDTDSLNPIFKGNITVKNRTELTMTDDESDIILKTIYDKDPSVQSVTKYSFSIEGYSLVAYIENFLNNKHAFFTIRNDGSEDCPYRTISYWNSIDSIIYSNN